jgi:membrane protein
MQDECTRSVAFLLAYAMHRRHAVLRRVWDYVMDNRVQDAATAAAFWLFFSLIPLVAVLTMAVAKAHAAAVEPFLASVPPATQKLVHDELASVAAWHGGTVGPLSMVVFVWLASSGVHATLNAFDVVTKQDRPWWKKRALALAICMALSLAVAIASVIIAAMSRGDTRAFLAFFMIGPARLATAFVAELAFIVALFVVAVPKGAGIRRWPGALLATALHMLLGYGYVLYLRTLGTGAYTATGLAAIVATMIALYLFVLSLLAGVMLNVMLAASAAPAPGIEVRHAPSH